MDNLQFANKRNAFIRIEKLYQEKLKISKNATNI